MTLKYNNLIEINKRLPESIKEHKIDFHDKSV